MGRLAIRNVIYTGDKYTFRSPELPDGIVVIEGPNGVGKTTFADLIYFGLGGAVPQFSPKSKIRHKEITSDTHNSLTLGIEINNEQYKLIRGFGETSKDISVVSMQTQEVEILPVVRREGKRIFSDWILEKLDIESVELYSGLYHGKINFSDVMRLIYHDQELDPRGIFKKLDHESFVTDSREFRKAIFEILIGKASGEYYSALAKLRASEQHYAEDRAVLNSFKEAISKISRGKEDANSHFLKEAISNAEARLKRLEVHRSHVRVTNSNQPARDSELAILRRELSNWEIQGSDLIGQENGINNELIQLRNLKDETINDIARIKKIIHAHESLSLFSPDTCPCCLQKIERTQGHCICNSPIEEGAYQKFFYRSSEYISIIKSKQKNVETIDGALKSYEEEKVAVIRKRAEVDTQINDHKKKIHRWAETTTSEGTTYGTELERIDDEIVELKVKLESLHTQLEIEMERSQLEVNIARLQEEIQLLKQRIVLLENKAREDAEEKIRLFNALYGRLMQRTVRDIRTARLDGDYMPVLNGGEYREASSSVAKRLMYFLALFELSVERDDVPFPRLLLIDTPETAGIDADNFTRALAQIATVMPAVISNKPCQVLLTTGINKYPPDFSPFRAFTLSESNRLLQPRQSDAVP